ncbi:hypothetical protein KAX17_03375 [Candidatus Bipolaricaulota bacterium]|nr:hypothetical protein [Candidatus Bipolaricaulota bacterium]
MTKPSIQEESRINCDIVVAWVRAALALLGVCVLGMMRRDKTQTEFAGRSRNQ